VKLEAHPDSRGWLAEVYRDSWGVGFRPTQWNLVRSRAGVLRGVHVHPRHDDYLIVVAGSAVIGLRDLRRGSPTEGLVTMVGLSGQSPAALVIEHGVAHGFFFLEESLHVYSVSHDWDPADELACHWRDPDLGLAWPAGEALVSPRDRDAPSLNRLLGDLAERFPGRFTCPGSPDRSWP
jgi:dTDP-4-dehydrorhamnose 3,5-epimerase